jgi:hypothetical protein
MTLSPLIVALCVNTGPTYTDACKAALEQGAAQSGFAGAFERVAKRTERDVIQYIDPSAEVEMAAAVAGYTAQIVARRSATIAIPNPSIKNSSIRMTVGEKETTVNFRIDF